LSQDLRGAFREPHKLSGSSNNKDGSAKTATQLSYKYFFLAAIIGIVLYVILDIIAQVLPPHYSPIRQAESDLAVGPYGYVMGINFVNRGILSLLFVFGLYRVVSRDVRLKPKFRVGAALLAIWGLCALILAAFPTDLAGAPVTIHGVIHLVTAAIAFICGAFGILLLSLDFGKELRSLRKYVLPIGVVSPILAFATFVLLTSRIGGLVERIFLASVLLWILIVSIYLFRESSRASPAAV
jgi:hypothetical membrane protein